MHDLSSRTRDRNCVPALADGFLTSTPPEKSSCIHLILQCGPNNLWKAAFCAQSGADLTAAAITSEQACFLLCFSFSHLNGFFSLLCPSACFLGLSSFSLQQVIEVEYSMLASREMCCLCLVPACHPPCLGSRDGLPGTWEQELDGSVPFWVCPLIL